MVKKKKHKSDLRILCKYWWWLKTENHEVCVHETTSYTFQPERDDFTRYANIMGLFHPSILTPVELFSQSSMPTN